MLNRGILIVLEGIDRSGKTTQSKCLVDYLSGKGLKTHLRRVPDRSEPLTGPAIDKFLQTATSVEQNKNTLHLLFSANRWAIIDEIKKFLDDGIVVICDRYVYSGISYSLAKGLERKWVISPDVGLPKPDIVLFFDIKPESARTRDGYGDEVFEKKSFQDIVYKEMKNLMLKNKDICKIINANRPVDEISKDIQNIVSEKLDSPNIKPLIYLTESDLL
ncbi:Thymidylate kinase [Strongyloides ratti]|uniref:Thymidylate kinase n=1 Tax=Strongyloides ratti TaxID=34506 RepID=A0A090LBG9_STRRB|nr:Thymidylate kinase [Strongyloides ratti]CEF64865.1 Thymidylate kinase [Strongyloides ratti]